MAASPPGPLLPDLRSPGERTRQWGHSRSAHGVLDGVGVELAAAARAAEEVGAALVLAAEADAGHVDDHPAYGITRLVGRRRRLRRRAELPRRLQGDELGEHRHTDLVRVDLTEVEAGR